MKGLTRTIWILSLISLFTDMASEMLYPVMPMYLKSINFTALSIGILEGLAEAIASLSKAYFGRISDESGRRSVFVRTGYGLSALTKPLLAAFANVPWVFFMRTLDRTGKGVRTAARDAILIDESSPENRGKVFGFHRSMDTLGAALGPSIALIYLFFNPGGYKALFLLSFFPGLAAVALTLVVREKSIKEKKHFSFRPFFARFSYWKRSRPEYRQLLAGLIVFSLFNSSDIFLLLRLKEAGATDMLLIGVYIFYNLIYAFSAFPLGAFADKVGLKNMFLAGLSLFAIVYAGMAFTHDKIVIAILFFIYGLYYGCTEGIAKAWISKLCAANEKATAIGVYSGLQGIAALAASTVTGIIWYSVGPLPALLTSSVAAAGVFFYLLLNKSIGPASSK